MMDSELTVSTQEQDLRITIVSWKCQFSAVTPCPKKKKKNLKNY